MQHTLVTRAGSVIKCTVLVQLDLANIPAKFFLILVEAVFLLFGEVIWWVREGRRLPQDMS